MNAPKFRFLVLSKQKAQSGDELFWSDHGTIVTAFAHKDSAETFAKNQARDMPGNVYYVASVDVAFMASETEEWRAEDGKA